MEKYIEKYKRGEILTKGEVLAYNEMLAIMSQWTPPSRIFKKEFEEVKEEYKKRGKELSEEEIHKIALARLAKISR